jgi:hypothetical protein
MFSGDVQLGEGFVRVDEAYKFTLFEGHVVADDTTLTKTISAAAVRSSLYSSLTS